jgi:hypothetical protein
VNADVLEVDDVVVVQVFEAQQNLSCVESGPEVTAWVHLFVETDPLF